jgi:hypothetical protein
MHDCMCIIIEAEPKLCNCVTYHLKIKMCIIDPVIDLVQIVLMATKL